MEILKIKLNEKQPIAQQIYLTEESDYGLAIQIDDLQSQGPELISFNGLQIISEKDKVADYNLFKLKTPKYDKTQNKYLIEIPDTDGSVTYKITVNIIQSETVYQDNGDNSSVELPAWTENIDGDTDFIYMKKNDVKLTTADLVVNFLGSTDPALSVGSTSTYIKRGDSELQVSFDDNYGITLCNADNGDTFNINKYGPSIHTEINDINFSSNSGDITLSSSTGNINIIANTKQDKGLKAIVGSFCICDNNNNLILSGGRNSNTYILGGTDSNKSAINIDSSINLCGKQDVTINSNNYISLRSKNTQLSSDNIEICGTNLKIYNSNIVVENNTSVTNAQLSYLFQIAQKLTPENLPNVLETLGLNT